MKKIILYLFAFGLFGFAANAQSPLRWTVAAQINDAGHVQLRWAPNDYDAWALGLENGFYIHRMISHDDQGLKYSISQRLQSKISITDHLLPLPESDWEQWAEQDEMVGVAAGAIFGEAFEVVQVDTSDITSIYATSQENQNRYGFSLMAADNSFDIAQAMALALVDDNVSIGFTYLYVIGLHNPPAGVVAQNMSIEIKVEAPVLPPAPTDLLLTPGDQLMQLNWKNSEGYPFSNYLIERSSDGGQTFTKANDNPLMFSKDGTLVYVDSLDNNNTTYAYRVTGVTPFNTLGMPSAVVQAEGKAKPLSTRAEMTSTEELESGHVIVNWTFPVELESEVAGIWVDRSDARNGITVRLNATMLSPSTRTFTDLNPISSNYYKITLQDINGNEVTSYAIFHQCKDETPPNLPAGLAGTCSNLGLVKLTWDANTDPDILGYRVYFSNQQDGYYAQVTKEWLRNPVFYYTVDMANLSEAIYFKVVALDKRENASDFSAPALVAIPDIHPPAAPVIEVIEAQGQGVFAKWISSRTADVVEHKLQRKAAFDPGWTTVLSFTENNDPKEHFDPGEFENVDYQYRLIAIDDADLQTSSRVYTIHPAAKSTIPGVTNLTVSYAGNLQRVYLQWNYPLDHQLHSFLIYRAAEDGTPYFYKTILYEREDITINPDDASNGQDGYYTFKDLDVKLHPRLTYWVVAKYISGAESEMAQGVMVMTP